MRFLLFFTLFSTLFSKVGYSLENNMDSFFPSLCDLPAFTFQGSYTDVKKAPFKKLGEEELKYRQLDLNFTYLHPFNSCNAFSLGVGFIGSELDWEENPNFTETNFGYVAVTLAGITQEIEEWVWKLGGAALIDTAKFDLSYYALYQIFLTGKYPICEPLIFNAGFILELGLKKDKIWPVFGFDFIPSEKLQLHLVYPLDVSLEYFFCEQFSLETSLRFLRNRHRVKDFEPLPMSIFEYRTMGVEFDVNIIPTTQFLITAFVGSTLPGDLKVTNRNNHHATHYKFKGSLYGGLFASLSY